MAVCLNHTDREAVTRCSACGKPICEECRISCGGASYCSEACREKGIAAGSRASDVIATRKKTESAAWVKRLIWFFILVAIAAAGYTYYQQNRKTIDKQLKSATETLQEKTGQATRALDSEIQSGVQSGDRAIPKSSKYKRERESLAN